MTSPAPASMPAGNGGRSSRSSAAAVLGQHRQLLVAVGGGVAVAREVLERRRRRRPPAGPATAAATCVGDRGRVAAERARADHAAAARRRARRRPGAKSTLMPSAASSAPAACHAASVSAGSRGRAERHRAGQLHHARPDPGDRAVLLVGADQQRRPRRRCAGRGLQPVGERAHLAGRVDVGRLVGAGGRVVGRPADQDQPAELVLRDHLGRRGDPGVLLVGRGRAAGDLGGVVAVRVRHEHLADQVLVGERRATARRPGRPGRPSGVGRRRRAAAPAAPATAAPSPARPSSSRASDRQQPRARHRERTSRRPARTGPLNQIGARIAPARAQPTRVSRVTGRALAGVPVRLQLGVPGGCRARGPARAPAPRTPRAVAISARSRSSAIMMSPLALVGGAEQAAAGHVHEPLAVDAGAGLLGDLEPEHRPLPQGGGELARRCRAGRTRSTRPAGRRARPAARSTPGGPARRGHARSPTRRAGTRRAGSSGRIRRHGLARLTSRRPRCVFPYDLDRGTAVLPCARLVLLWTMMTMLPPVRQRCGDICAGWHIMPCRDTVRRRVRSAPPVTRLARPARPRRRSRFTGHRQPVARSPAVASNTSKTARASVRAGQAGAAAPSACSASSST